GARAGIYGLERDPEPFERPDVDDRLAEAEDADALPAAPPDLLQGRFDHAQDLAPGRLLDLRLDQMDGVGCDDEEVGHAAEPLRGVEQARVWLQGYLGLSLIRQEDGGMPVVVDEHRRVAAVLLRRDQALCHTVDAGFEIHRGLGAEPSEN